MRTKVLIAITLMVLAMLAVKCPAESWDFEKDKRFHLAAGAATGAVLVSVASYSDLTKWEAFGVTVLSAFAVGLAKETMDIAGTGFSPADLVYTTAGGVIPATVTFTWKSSKSLEDLLSAIK